MQVGKNKLYTSVLEFVYEIMVEDRKKKLIYRFSIYNVVYEIFLNNTFQIFELQFT